MSDAKTTGFSAYPFESVEMTLSYLNYRDIGENTTHIYASPPIYKSLPPLVHHPCTISAFDAKQHRVRITNPT